METCAAHVGVMVMFFVAIDKVSVCLSVCLCLCASVVKLGVHLLEHFPQFSLLISSVTCIDIRRIVIGKFIVQL